MVTGLCASIAVAQISTDVLGAHDMSFSMGAPISGNLGSPCMYCHAPHSSLSGESGTQPMPLWSQTLSSVQSYQVYSSSTMVNVDNPSPPLGSNSTLCLSCHDGTVALGTLTPYGQVTMTSSLSGTPADLGTNLQTTHPFSFITPLQPAPDLWPSLSANPPSTQDQTGAVQLINGNVECGSCHNPHVQNIDSSGDFLVIDNSESALCLACHNTVPSGGGMGMSVTAQVTSKASKTSRNMLALWKTSIHATGTNRIASQVSPNAPSLTEKTRQQRVSLGPYATLKANGCLSCHKTHSSATSLLLRGQGDQTCINCHNGGTSVSPPAPNIYAEMASPKIGHASIASTGKNAHSAHESDLLNNNRHAACADCHNPHATERVGLSFTVPPAVRPSQKGVAGISVTDGRSVVFPAANQYENCLRCHGTSTGKNDRPTVFGYLPRRLAAAADPLNVIPQFGPSSISSHPVIHERSSSFPQPSLRSNMLHLDGSTQGRSMGVRILCTDCHNSDDNREFGGSGANGPHGSKYPHILERRYDMSLASTPGQPIMNLNFPPDLSATGNYALCAKCHDLTQIMRNTSFNQHARHINDGFSCSVCHTAHGMGAEVASVSGIRMVNFDLNVVAPSSKTPVSYSKGTNSCSLTCHGHAHNLGGVQTTSSPPVRKK
jgi:predicted CXXCH cytochrome family protein